MFEQQGFLIDTCSNVEPVTVCPPSPVCMWKCRHPRDRGAVGCTHPIHSPHSSSVGGGWTQHRRCNKQPARRLPELSFSREIRPVSGNCQLCPRLVLLSLQPQLPLVFLGQTFDTLPQQCLPPTNSNTSSLWSISSTRRSRRWRRRPSLLLSQKRPLSSSGRS